MLKTAVHPIFTKTIHSKTQWLLFQKYEVLIRKPSFCGNDDFAFCKQQQQKLPYQLIFLS